ncbi:MAG TPA: sulfatase-like hydrolase/transferase [Bryobacteraceae bacterium]|nr:sulfatase-like hydrolase/transferase [Bryobacteraceae bacterium]
MMLRREFMGSAAAACSLAAGASSSPPNFLFLIADDLTFNGIHALGGSEVHTPNLDRMVSRGCSFTHCFHQGSWLGAVCVASRSMLNSGLTAFRARRQVEEAPLWGETLGKAAYDTFLIGKWHLSQANLKRSFQRTGKVSGGMFESGPDAYNRPRAGNTWTPWDTSLKGQWLHTAAWQDSQSDAIKHSARIWAEAAAGHLAAQAKSEAPFFLYVGFNSPHDPRQAPKEFVDRYPAARIAIPPNYLPEHPFDQGDHANRDESLAPFPRTREAIQVHRSEYYAHITYMDEQIGRILDALEASGKAANTYVIFTSDHGLAVGQHGLMGKQNMYDHSIRMPLLICGPGIPQGRQVHEMVYQHSVFPTTCELAGIPIPKTVEFPSLVNMLKGKSAAGQDAVFCYYRDFQRAVRTSGHKLIVYPQAGVTQLFDLKKDPWETENVADNKEYAAIRTSLTARLHRFQRELEDDIQARC